MIQLAYTSISNRAFSRAQLLTLLQQARLSNELLNITGILLYKDSSFFQVIEGDKLAVTKLMIAISQDKRHQQIDILFNRKTDKRDFDGWSMGYVNIDDQTHDLSDCCREEFEFPFQEKAGSLSQLVDVSTAKILVRRFANLGA
ncbi:BLUF domain-containing protein [Glaciecola sp. KUL10]|jgi:hypothetical protein|uniref:BLUF domain-containing protein n=1 Tax=Glaciecola sp. (strain KUL10) TaxID=2161813 RepID=UPI000D785590|nr:BLUF domain-containing protein [Glaciecola sp. KUL10]GBL05004.1 expression activator-related protein [Glaciecola sp. KUL10]